MRLHHRPSGVPHVSGMGETPLLDLCHRCSVSFGMSAGVRAHLPASTPYVHVPAPPPPPPPLQNNDRLLI